MRIVLFFFLTLLLIGCKDPLDKNFETVSEHYKIGYFSKPNKNVFVLCYDCDDQMGVIVNQKIKRFGSDERFAIIERVGNYDDLDAVTLDSLILRYYNIDMTLKPDIMDSAYCFRTDDYEKFLNRKKALGVATLDFTKEFSVD